MAQLPRVLVCEVTACDEDDDEDDDELDEALPVLPEATTAVESSDSPDSSDSRDTDVLPELRLLVLAAAVWVVVAAWPSCHASTPPSDSIEAMLSA